MDQMLTARFLPVGAAVGEDFFNPEARRSEISSHARSPVRRSHQREEERKTRAQANARRGKLFTTASEGNTAYRPDFEPQNKMGLSLSVRPHFTIVDGTIHQANGPYALKYPRRSPKADLLDTSRKNKVGGVNPWRHPKNRPSTYDGPF